MTQPTRSGERDQKRGYAILWKPLAAAFSVEVGVASTSLAGAWLYAQQYGHDEPSRIMMMLAPAAYALVELSRVPLAVASRAHPSALMRTVALGAVLCAAGVTVKSVSQLGQMQFQPRLDNVVAKRAQLLDAKSSKVIVEDRIQAAKQDVETAKSIYDEAEARAKAASGDVTKLPPAKCSAVTETKRDGSVVQSRKCIADARTTPMVGNMTTAAAALKTAKEELDTAKRRLNALDPTVAERAITAAEIAYRNAIHNSQLHSFAAMMFGKDATEVTDGEVNSFLRIFVFGAAILVSLSATLLAMTAVVRLKKPKIAEIPDDGLLRLLAPMREDIVRTAAQDVANDIKHDFVRDNGSQPPRNDEPTTQSEAGDVIVMARRKKEITS